MNALYKILMIYALTCTLAVNAVETIQEPRTEQNAQLETFKNEEKGYSVEYPSDWKKSDVPQLDLVLFAPTKDHESTPHASMNIVSEKVGSAVSLEQFYTESAANLSSALKEVHVEKSGSSTLNGTPSKWTLYTHVMQGVKFRVLQYFVVANDSIYLMTFSTAADDFDGYKGEFEKIANSFKITAPSNSAAPAPQK
jgi:hypothetical protein